METMSQSPSVSLLHWAPELAWDWALQHVQIVWERLRLSSLVWVSLLNQLVILTVFPELSWDQEARLKCKNIAKNATCIINRRGLLLQITLYPRVQKSRVLNMSLQIASISHIPKIKLSFFLGEQIHFSCRSFAVCYASSMSIF